MFATSALEDKIDKRSYYMYIDLKYYRLMSCYTFVFIAFVFAIIVGDLCSDSLNSRGFELCGICSTDIALCTNSAVEVRTATYLQEDCVCKLHLTPVYF